MSCRRKQAIFTVLFSLLVASVLPAQPVHITMATWNSTEADIRRANRIIREFEAAHPGISVEFEYYTYDNYNQALLTRHIVGNPPDVFLANARHMPSFIERRLVMPLDAWVIDGRIDTDEYYPVALSAFEANGSLYALPKDFSSMMLFYNEELLRDAGINDPQALDTWEKIYDAASRIRRDTNGDGVVDQFGVFVDKWFYTLAPFIWSHGGEIISPDYTTTVGYLDSARTVGAVEFYRDMITSGIAPTPAAVQSWGDPTNAFAHNRIGILLNGHWAIASMAEKIDQGDLSVGVIDLPRSGRSDGGTNVIYPVGIGIMSGTDHPEEAITFARWLTGPSGGEIEILDSFIGLGAHRETNKLLLEYDPYDLVQAFVQSIEHSRVPVGSQVKDWFKAEEVFVTAIDRILNGDASTTEALRSAANEIDRLLLSGK